MRELGERGGLGREGETQNVEREKIELGEGRKERERKKKGKKQYFAENHGIKNKKKTIVLQQTAINDCSSIVKKFDNNTTNVALFLWFWLLKVAIQQYDNTNTDALNGF